jgi:hypothetical protein
MPQGQKSTTEKNSFHDTVAETPPCKLAQNPEERTTALTLCRIQDRTADFSSGRRHQ